MGGSMAAIQYRRAKRVGVDGISPLTESMFLMVGLFFMAYSLVLHSVPLFFATLFSAPYQLAVLLTIGWSKTWRTMLGALAIVTFAIVLPTVLWGWNVGAGSVGIVMVFTRLPQIVDLIRMPSVEGVSVVSWLLSSVNLGLWLYYYGYHHDTGAAISMVVTITSNLLIVVITALRHRHTKVLFARVSSRFASDVA
jgi:uncharacterized protein with PQ loop repeat